jgi:beta-propeller repeat-containing protein
MSQCAPSPSRGLFVLFPFLAGVALSATAATENRLSESYGKLPLHFEANLGQTDKNVHFLSRGPGYNLYLTANEAVLVLSKPNADVKRDARGAKAQQKSLALRMSLVGAARSPLVSGLEEQPGKANYFISGDRSKWRTNVPTYAKVRYQNVYPGIDLVYYGNQRQLEYDFVVAPGADPKKIVLGFKGADKLEIDAQGDLVLHAAGGDIRQHKPIVYQEIDGVRREVDGGYVIKPGKRVGFRLAAYDTTRPLIIDPMVLAYSTYLGGFDGDYAMAIVVDADGNAYVAGGTAAPGFPTTAGAFQSAFPGGFGTYTFVTKLNPSGTALVYSTYLGSGNGYSSATGIAVDAAGNAYVTGGTQPPANYPTTPGAFQPANAGTYGNAFVTKLDPSGSALVYSTYLGGSTSDSGTGIAVDADGNAYVTGKAGSSDFPTTAGALQPAYGGSGDAFVTKLNPAGSALVYSTYLGGSSQEYSGGIAIDAAGNAYVAGSTQSANFPTTAEAFQAAFGGAGDAFVTKLNSTGSALVYSTYLRDGRGTAIAVDVNGNAYVTGTTYSPNFPTTAAAFQTTYAGGYTGYSTGDAFVTKLDPTGSALVYSTYLGGSDGGEWSAGIAVDAGGNAYVTGDTASTNFPTTLDAFQTTYAGGYDVYTFRDAFVTKLNPTGSALVYSTYLGGNKVDSAHGIAADGNGNAYVAGSTNSSNFPTTPGAFQANGHTGAGYNGHTYDAFVAKFSNVEPSPPPPLLPLTPLPPLPPLPLF